MIPTFVFKFNIYILFILSPQIMSGRADTSKKIYGSIGLLTTPKKHLFNFFVLVVGSKLYSLHVRFIILMLFFIPTLVQ